MCDQLHGDGQGHWGAPWLPPDQGAADQGGITAAEKGFNACIVCINVHDIFLPVIACVCLHLDMCDFVGICTCTFQFWPLTFLITYGMVVHGYLGVIKTSGPHG